MVLCTLLAAVSVVLTRLRLRREQVAGRVRTGRSVLTVHTVAGLIALVLWLFWLPGKDGSWVLLAAPLFAVTTLVFVRDRGLVAVQGAQPAREVAQADPPRVDVARLAQPHAVVAHAQKPTCPEPLHTPQGRTERALNAS